MIDTIIGLNLLTLLKSMTEELNLFNKELDEILGKTHNRKSLQSVI